MSNYNFSVYIIYEGSKRYLVPYKNKGFLKKYEEKDFMTKLKETKKKTKFNKFPLMKDSSFKALFANEKELIPLTLFLSIILDIDYDKLLGNIELDKTKYPKSEPDKKADERDIVIIVKYPKPFKVMIEINYFKPWFNGKKHYLQEDITMIIKVTRDIFYKDGTNYYGLKKGEDYDILLPIILIELSPFLINPNQGNIIEEFELRDKYGFKLFNDIEFTNINKNFKLTNINVALVSNMWYNGNINEEELSDYEKKIIPMIALLTASNMKDVDKCLKHINTSSEIKKIIRKEIRKMNENNYEFGIPYDPVEDWRKIFRGAINTYKNELKNSKKIIETSKQEKLDMIKDMYKKGLTLEFISDITKLSISEVEKIVKHSKIKK